MAALASRKSARPTKLDTNGQSPFHLAASKDLTECLTILLANGADINSKNEDGESANPVHAQCAAGLSLAAEGPLLGPDAGSSCGPFLLCSVSLG